jgi:hypothetical protein
MVLFYGLLALETANNIVSARTSQRETISKKCPSSSMSSSSNSWIYTEDLKKRYTNSHYIFVPIYIDKRNCRCHYNSTLLIPKKSAIDNSWMYSKSFHDRLFNSTSKISSSASSITNQRFIRNEKIRKKHFCQTSSSSKNNIVTVEEDDEETTENDNHSIPLIKHQ